MKIDSFLIFNIGFTLLDIWFIYTAILLVYKVIRSRKMLREIRADNETAVHGINVQFKLFAYLIVMTVEVLGLIYVAGFTLPFYISSGFRLLTVDAVGMIAFFLMRLFIHLIALFQEKHVYLTKNGLITLVECLPFSKCRFAWENSASGQSDMLHVYTKKDRMPFTAQFDGDIAAAHALTAQYASGGAPETESISKQ
ncbi:MAG: hypothetical protein J6Z40_08035 [Oscillospiraceae bacterium]|nr:hypothetical protein [Oscillospiraceae bacterium]MBQ9906907.1 hypothetical protein [Oscillospiraceae bacterium]